LGNPLVHEQSLTGGPGGIWVDTELVELLEKVWAAGLKTSLSCQGQTEPHPLHGSMPAYIVFADEQEAWKFLDGCDRSGATVILVKRGPELRAEWMPAETEQIAKGWKGPEK
jgi:hypothetical protein